MATIQKTYTTSLEAVTVLEDSVRASIAVRDTAEGRQKKGNYILDSLVR